MIRLLSHRPLYSAVDVPAGPDLQKGYQGPNIGAAPTHTCQCNVNTISVHLFITIPNLQASFDESIQVLESGFSSEKNLSLQAQGFSTGSEKSFKLPAKGVSSFTVAESDLQVPKVIFN